jgi:hypothetical protein
MLYRVTHVRTDVSKESISSMIILARIRELGSSIAVCKIQVLTAVTMKNVVFWDIKTEFELHRRHITSPLQCPAS